MTFDALQSMISAATYAYRPTQDPDQQAAWNVTEELIAEIERECSARTIECLVFTASSPVQVFPDEKFRHELMRRNALDDLFYSERRLDEFCRQSKIPFFPLASKLAAKLETEKAFFHGFDRSLGLGHWNETGHATAARLVADRLLQGAFAAKLSPTLP